MSSEIFKTALSSLPRHEISDSSETDLKSPPHIPFSSTPVTLVSLPPTPESLAARALHVMEAIERPKIDDEDGELCVVVPTHEEFVPRYGGIESDTITIHWIHYRGFRQSPLLPIPRRLKRSFCNELSSTQTDLYRVL